MSQGELDPYWPLHNKSYSSKYTDVFERQIQPNENVTQPPAMIFNQWLLQFFVWNYVKKKQKKKHLYICCCIWYSTLLRLIVRVRGQRKCNLTPPYNLVKRSTWSWTYLSGWSESCIFLVCFCYWPNSLMKGDEGGIFSKAPDWKTLFLLKMNIKQNTCCPNKDK